MPYVCVYEVKDDSLVCTQFGFEKTVISNLVRVRKIYMEIADSQPQCLSTAWHSNELYNWLSCIQMNRFVLLRIKGNWMEMRQKKATVLCVRLPVKGNRNNSCFRMSYVHDQAKIGHSFLNNSFRLFWIRCNETGTLHMNEITEDSLVTRCSRKMSSLTGNSSWKMKLLLLRCQISCKFVDIFQFLI